MDQSGAPPGALTHGRPRLFAGGSRRIRRTNGRAHARSHATYPGLVRAWSYIVTAVVGAVALAVVVPIAIFAPGFLLPAGLVCLAIAAYTFFRPANPDEFPDDWADVGEAAIVLVATLVGAACIAAGLLI